MNRNLPLALVFIVAMGSLAACGAPFSSTLSRGKAKDIIERHETFRSQQIKLSLTPDDVQRGIKARYWKEEENFFNFMPPFTPLLVLLPEGQKHFSGFDPQLGGVRNLNFIRRPRPYVVEVTGITDAPGTVSGPNGTAKVVEFTWNAKLDNQDRDVADVVELTPVKGTVLMRLYDDGWRAEFQ